MSSPDRYPPRLVSFIFEEMQSRRLRLIEMATGMGANTKEGQRCLLLAQVLEIGKDAMKEPFMKALE